MKELIIEAANLKGKGIARKNVVLDVVVKYKIDAKGIELQSVQAKVLKDLADVELLQLLDWNSVQGIIQTIKTTNQDV